MRASSVTIAFFPENRDIAKRLPDLVYFLRIRPRAKAFRLRAAGSVRKRADGGMWRKSHGSGGFSGAGRRPFVALARSCSGRSVDQHRSLD
jgi:hypothetical protein